MTKKRNPTEHTEERSGSAAAPGSQNVSDDAEQAEYADYSPGEGTEGQDQGEGQDRTRDREAEARREAGLQPGGQPRPEDVKKKEQSAEE